MVIMPIYEYRCSSCGKEFEVELPIKKFNSLKKCVLCGSKKIERLIGEVYAIVKNDNTIYSLAQKNSKKLGKEQVLLKEEQIKQDKRNKKDNLSRVLKEMAPKAEIKTVAKLPWYNKDGTDLKKKFEGKTKGQIKKFISDGEI